MFMGFRSIYYYVAVYKDKTLYLEKWGAQPGKNGRIVHFVIKIHVGPTHQKS